jgi:predicted transposase YdaD
MGDMDQGLKRLLQARPADVLALALPGIEYLEPMPTQVATEPQLELDTLFRARFEGLECAVDVEVQTYPDPTMPRRCFEYGSRASIVHKGLPVFSVVLWLQPRGPIPPSPYEMRVGSWKQATWEIINVEVYRLVATAILASGALGLMPLVSFMAGADVPVIQRAAHTIKDQAPPDLTGDLVSLLAVFTARFHGDSAARALVRSVFMSTDLLEESPLYRAWRAEARAEGEAAGRAEGLHEATRTALEGRFGTLDEETGALLDAATEPALRAVLAHIAIDTLDQVRERLRQQNGQAG